MLTIRQFKKSYVTGFELKIESLRLESGIHMIRGENGSGKSTLMRAIAGIHDFEGEICFENLNVKKHPVPYRKMIGFSDADPKFPEFLSLDELIEFVKGTRKVEGVDITFLKRVLLVGDYSRNPIASYSSGMVKKTGLLLAFLGNPKLVILDEPFTTIDLQSQHNLVDLIKSKEKEGASFLLTSHQTDTGKLFDFKSVVTMSNGEVVRKQ
jgi:ABC-2 type transport system ATP-binding protein